MELPNTYLDDHLDPLLAYLRFSSRDVAIIKSNYRVSADKKDDLKKAIVRHYLRSSRQYTPVEFTKVEWVIAILFFLDWEKALMRFLGSSRGRRTM